MFFLLAVVVIGGLVAVVVASAASGRRPDGRSGMPVGLLVGGGVVGIVVLLAGAGFLLRGVGAPGDEAERPVTTPPPSVDDRTPAAVPPAVAVRPGPPLPVVNVPAADPARFGSYDVIDRLSPDSIVVVRATGFESFEPGRVQQCVSEIGRMPGCTPSFPVQFAEDGRAEFQYQLRDSFAPGGCRSGGPTCIVQVTGLASGRRGSIQTVLVDDVAIGRVDLEPRAAIVDGQRVEVTVTGFPADATLLATICAPPGGYDPRSCLAGEAASRFRTGPNGSGRTTMVVRTVAIGTQRVPCGPRHPCGVAIVSEEGFVASATVPMRFSLGPGAVYQGWRVAGGLAVATLLVIIALLIIRRTEWNAPTEAATPAVDEADLETDLSLDELFGTDAELEAQDPVHL